MKAVSVNWGFMSVIRKRDDYHYTPEERERGVFTGGPHVLFIDVNGIAQDGSGADFVPFGSVAVVDGQELGRTAQNIPTGGHDEDFVELHEQPYMRSRGGRMRLVTGHTPQGSDPRVISLAVRIHETDGTVAEGAPRTLTFQFE